MKLHSLDECQLFFDRGLFICHSSLPGSNLWLWLCSFRFNSSTEITSAALCLWVLLDYLKSDLLPLHSYFLVMNNKKVSNSSNTKSRFMTDSERIITFNYPHLYLLHIWLLWKCLKCQFVKIASIQNENLHWMIRGQAGLRLIAVAFPGLFWLCWVCAFHSTLIYRPTVQ